MIKINRKQSSKGFYGVVQVDTQERYDEAVVALKKAAGAGLIRKGFIDFVNEEQGFAITDEVKLA